MGKVASRPKLTGDELDQIRGMLSVPVSIEQDGRNVVLLVGAARRLMDTVEAVTAERDELQASFDIRWSADMRAIKRWQEAHPGHDLVWPDHADLVVWLMEQVDGP